MIIYEIVAIISGMLAALTSGLCWAMMKSVNRAHRDLWVTRVQLLNKVGEFDDITKKASESNASHANKIIELENYITALDERIGQLSGNATVTGAGNPWQPRKQI